MELIILKELCYAPILSRNDKINRLKTIGRKMPFGKYKGHSVLWLLVKHWKYMKWILDNTNFKLNEIEEWFNNYLDEQESLLYTTKILYGLSQVISKDSSIMDDFPETNPHYIIE